MKPYHFLILLLIVASVSACKSDKSADTDQVAEVGVETVEKKYNISPFSRSTQYPDAKLSNMTYKNGTFNFDVTGSDYKLGDQTPDREKKMCANSGKGQHIHLLIDT